MGEYADASHEHDRPLHEAALAEEEAIAHAERHRTEFMGMTAARAVEHAAGTGVLLRLLRLGEPVKCDFVPSRVNAMLDETRTVQSVDLF